MRATRRVLVLTAAVAGLAGCGSASPAEQVRSALTGFEAATAKHDYKAICSKYLAPALVERVEQTGLACEAALQPELGSLRKPTLTVLSVTVRGATASARVHTTAANQKPSTDTIRLVRAGGSWRIASLGGG